jgi:serine/threonine-protein kinase
MSRTYVAMEQALSRRVVVKVLSPELAAGVSVDRFRREIMLAAKLQHPHVVPVLSSGDAGGSWFTMPYVEASRCASWRAGTGDRRDPESCVTSRALDLRTRMACPSRHQAGQCALAGSSATVTDFGIAKAISAARTGRRRDTHHGRTSIGHRRTWRLSRRRAIRTSITAGYLRLRLHGV